ncbi:MAG: CocE/NonD family hydrolase, partial [Candidatus Binatia bacterium]
MRLPLAMAMIAATSAFADGVPVVGEPILKPDSAFEATSWGYKKKDLSLAPAPPAGQPEGYRWPTVMTMEGYDGASRPDPNAYLRMDDGELMALRIRFGDGPRGDYAFVQASIRGTECSGGHFDLYDRRHALDGHHIIEWLATQPWSNERVGMFGSSYPGQTAYFVATTTPPHLHAISANLLHSDIYRDIFMPGAVQNFLFPSLWTYGLGVVAGPHRIPINSIEEGTIPEDEICLQAQLTRYSFGDLPQPENEPAFAAVRATDDQWYQAHAALTYAHTIKIPYYQQGNWQDEQVGPRAVVLWHHIHPDPKTIIDKNGQPATVIPKKFVLSSG